VEFDPALTGKALGARLADIEAAMARLDSFAFSTNDTTKAWSEARGDAPEAARELILRVLGTVSDTVNFRVLTQLGGRDRSLSELATATGLPRLALWERINDLVQVGLVARALEGDRAGLTGPGQSLVDLVEEMAAAAAEGQSE
jgi:DNA-binding HxlR family transcriptional regulator